MKMCRVAATPTQNFKDFIQGDSDSCLSKASTDSLQLAVQCVQGQSSHPGPFNGQFNFPRRPLVVYIQSHFGGSGLGGSLKVQRPPSARLMPARLAALRRLQRGVWRKPPPLVWLSFLCFVVLLNNKLYGQYYVGLIVCQK